MRNRPNRRHVQSHATARPVTRPAPRPALLEGLESRRLMSGTGMIAHPLSTAYPAGSGVPLGSGSPVGYTPAQIKGAYGITGTGAGQTIAVVVAYDDPNIAGDLSTFSSQFGLGNPGSFTKVNQYGQSSLPSVDTTGGWANETALDVEWVHAIAPSANILLVECNSASLDDLISAGVNYARSASGVSVVTMSFAATEASGETGYDGTFTTPGGHQGVTFVAASGDGGSPGGYPAMSPNVVSVGATTLTVNGNSYGGETGRSKSGGGYSTYESRPSYQNASNQTAKRSSPDVAFDGDPNTGVAVYDSYNGGTSNGWYKVGGTSFSAPAWAGLIAVTDQTRVGGGKATLDGPTGTLPGLYNLYGTSAFHDITSGNNGYAAAAGYDLVTGLGTPVAGTLIPALAGVSTSPSPTPTPTPTATISGYVYNTVTGSGYAGGTVYLDLNNNGSQDSNEYGVAANGYGYYTIGGLPAGTYVLRENNLSSGYTLTAPSAGYQSVTLTTGQNAAGVSFGNTAASSSTPGSISGYVYNSNTGTGFGGTTVYLDLNKDGVQDNGEYGTVANQYGYYSFGNMPAGTYLIRETVSSGYTQTAPSTGYQSVTLSAGQNATGVSFGNAPGAVSSPGTISGYVFNSNNGSGFGGATVYLDLNNNGKQDNGEYGTVANQYGYFIFGNMPAGTYVIRETTPAGYTQTYPANGYQSVTLAAGQNATNISFGNRPA